MERKIYTPPYRPQSNGHIKGFHNFLKACLSKHISRNREWDDITQLATASYNWLPNQHSRESPFFIMFGRDALTNLQHLIKPKLRYMGTSELILDLKLMSNIYPATDSQSWTGKTMSDWRSEKPMPNPDIKTGDLVLVKDHTSKTFMPKYKTDFHIIRVLGNKVEVKDNNGKMSWYHISDVKKTDMVTKLICQLPDYDAFGMVGRLSFDPERVQDLGWTASDQDLKFNPDHVSDPPNKNQRSHPSTSKKYFSKWDHRHGFEFPTVTPYILVYWVILYRNHF